MNLDNGKIDHVDSFTYLGCIISKDGGSSEFVKSRIAKAVVFTVKKSLEELEDKSAIQV